MTKHLGSCLCGTVKFKVTGQFESFYLCHCRHCQKDTGSAHAANMFSQSATITWLAGEEALSHFTLAGTRHSKSFCKHCGSALPNTHTPGLLVVPAGSLDTPLTMAPGAHIFTASKAAWDSDLAMLPAFKQLPL